MRVPDDPAYWFDMAQEHGRCLADFMRAGLDPHLCYEQALVAFFFARKFQRWSDAREQELAGCELCADKYRPEGTERGEPFDLMGLIGE